MSWHGGKGDKPRPVDKKAFDTNYDNIFRKKEVYNLFLDDLRVVKDAVIHKLNRKLIEESQIPAVDWWIVRSYDDFVKTVKEKGVPNVVSFDNDLSQEQTRYFVRNHEKNGFNVDVYNDNGISCARFLIQYCKEQNKPLPTYYVHSANYHAVDFIENLMKHE